MTPATWTPERTARLAQLVGDGVTFEAIGATLGITKNAAIGKATRMGFERSNDAALTAIQLARKRVKKKRAEVRASAAGPNTAFPPSHCCVWPHGDPDAAGFHFCGAATAAPGLPYCRAHMLRAYVAPGTAQHALLAVEHASTRAVGEAA